MALKHFVDQYSDKYRLTDRESQVLYHLVNRVVNPAEIGKLLDISLYTVNNHLKKILEKTKVDSKTELLADFLLSLNNQMAFATPRSPKVLILDDETELTQMLKTFFESKNIEAYTFNCPIKALEEIRRLKIDVVISDIRMPKLNGVSFLREIRKIHQYEPGFIFISGFPEEYEVESLLDLGAIAFLEKPINFEKLNRLVWEYVYGAQESNESPMTVCLGDIPLSASQFGFGGFFLGQDQLSEHKNLKLEEGGKIEVQFQIPSSQEKFKAQCEVVWKRLADTSKPGYGLKFLDLATPAKRELMEFVRTNNILSFIPKGI